MIIENQREMENTRAKPSGTDSPFHLRHQILRSAANGGLSARVFSAFSQRLWQQAASVARASLG